VLRVQGVGFRVSGLGYGHRRARGRRRGCCGVQGAGCRVQGAGCRVQGAGTSEPEDEEGGVVEPRVRVRVPSHDVDEVQDRYQPCSEACA
jgi:hypothetical protein